MIWHNLQKSIFYLLSVLTTALVLAMTPLIATGVTYSIFTLDGIFYPDGLSAGQEFTLAVGDTVAWGHLDSSVHTIVADTTQGDFQGNVCYEPGGLSGILYEHGQYYFHTFTVPQPCYYRCTLHPPLMQGVVRVSGSGGNQPPSAVSLTPVNISTVPGTARSFTAVYSDPNGWQNISDASLALSGTTHNELLHYNPATNKFTLVGASGDCSPGNGATLSNGFLNLNCGPSNISGSGNTLTLTINLTPQPPLSGAAYLLVIAAIDQGGASNSKTTGTWVINRPPSVGSASPMNSATPVGTLQVFTVVYSDPDGWQNIAAANFYLSGNGGVHNEWLHYLASPNLFTMMGTNAVCSPGQATTLSNGFLTLNCATSTVSGSGTTLTVTFRVTPQAPSSGINYNIFTATSDQAGAAFGTFGGTWQIP